MTKMASLIKVKRVWLLLLGLLMAVYLDSSQAQDERSVFTTMDANIGGDMTIDSQGKRAFNRVTGNILKVAIDDDLYAHDLLFEAGNAVFIDSWVMRGSSTSTRDGLGPFFNARSCQSCHIQDGKGSAPTQSGIYQGVGLLLRLSSLNSSDHKPHSIYGDQLQDFATSEAMPEAKIEVHFSLQKGHYPDGHGYELRVPQYGFHNPQYGPLHARISPRLAPTMVGLGLLETIPISTLKEFADPNDANGDGVSGRLSVLGHRDGREIVGRFGWKAGQESIMSQTAGAFWGDLGITSNLHPHNNCPQADPECDGGRQAAPEVTNKQLKRLELYASLLGVPARRNVDDQQVQAGAGVFYDLQCQSCHRVQIMTSHQSTFPETRSQLIHPFTDLLLHDLGEGLSDQRPMAHAQPQEWRTAPLWGVGLVKDVNPEAGYLHDGRARTIEEAILWHGGEAERHRNQFMNLPATQRALLLKYLANL